MRRNLLCLSIVSLLLTPSLLPADPVYCWSTEFDLTPGFIRDGFLAWTETSGGQVVIGAASGVRVALFNMQGDTLPGWPTTETEDWWVTAGPRLGDVTGDGELNVVVMMRSYYANHAQLRVYNFDGTLRDEFTRSWYEAPLPTAGHVVLADLNNDGVDNVVYAMDSVYAVDTAGQQLPGFPLPIAGARGGFMRLAVIPDDLEPGKAIVTTSLDSINVIDLSTGQNLPGWPQPFEDSGGLQSAPLVLPYEDAWAIAMHTPMDGLHLWNSAGDLVPPFPRTVGSQQVLVGGLSATDVDVDGIPEIVAQWSTLDLYVVRLTGQDVIGYPWEWENPYHGSGVDVSSLHVEDEAAVRFFFPISREIGDYEFETGVMSLEGNNPSSGFPVYYDRIEPLRTFNTTALVWTDRSDTLSILHMMSYGHLSRFDLVLPEAAVKALWPMPCGNSKGNRIYTPQQYVDVPENTASSVQPPPTPAIHQIYPNPANAAVRIELEPFRQATVTLRICNLLGQEVWSRTVQKSDLLLTWPGIDLSGAPVASGRYFAVLAGQPNKPVPFTILR